MKTARNDGQRERILSFYNDGSSCHFERSVLAQSEKSKEFKIHFDFMDTSPKAQYDKEFCKLLCHIEPFAKKAKYPLAKTAHFFILSAERNTERLSSLKGTAAANALLAQSKNSALSF